MPTSVASSPQDDLKAVPNGSSVYRRIAADWWIDDGEGGRRVSSQAFQDKDGYMSVAVGAVLDEMELGPEAALNGHEGYGLARLDVSFLRLTVHLGLTCLPTESEPWHGGVWGKKTSGVKNRLQGVAEIVVVPGNDSPNSS